jgi:hypothetical protein
VQCPNCRGTKVRASRRKGIDVVVLWGNPCRCRSCRERFFRYPATRFLPFALALAATVAVAALLLTRVIR